MNELTILESGIVPVYTTDTGEKVCDGRELWEALKSKQDFSTWIKRRFNECDATLNEDYSRLHKKVEANNATQIDYIIKLAIAKEMAMLERNEVGKQVRKYFIRVEEKYKSITGDLTKKLNAEARAKNAAVRKAKELIALAERYPGQTFQQILHSYATVELTGERLIPLPQMEERTLTAEEVGQRLGLSANMVGRLANAHNLKTDEYGAWFNDKAKHSNKEVPSFRYYENIVPVLESLTHKS